MIWPKIQSHHVTYIRTYVFLFSREIIIISECIAETFLFIQEDDDSGADDDLFAKTTHRVSL